MSTTTSTLQFGSHGAQIGSSVSPGAYLVVGGAANIMLAVNHVTMIAIEKYEAVRAVFLAVFICRLLDKYKC